MVKKKKFLNLCTLDNRTPLVFLASHPALQFQSPTSDMQKEQARDNLIEIFTENINDKKQILVTFDMIARRRHFQQFEHLHHLIRASPPEIRAQILHLVCCHDNVNLLKWLISQGQLKEYLNAPDHAGYTPLLTATFYESKECVTELLKVCFHFFLTVIYKAVTE